MFGSRYGTVIVRPYNWCLMSRKDFGSREGAASRYLEGTLSAREYSRIVCIKVLDFLRQSTGV